MYGDFIEVSNTRLSAIVYNCSAVNFGLRAGDSAGKIGNTTLYKIGKEQSVLFSLTRDRTPHTKETQWNHKMI